MAVNPADLKKSIELRFTAQVMRREGISYRKIGRALGKSHEWARWAVKSLEDIDLKKLSLYNNQSGDKQGPKVGK